MFVNKINGVSNLGFKGYQHIKNDVGETIMKFNYPYDYDKETCEVQFFRVTPTEKYNYKLDETPIASVQLKPEGVDVNLQTITNLDKEDAFAYKIVRKDKNTGKVIWEGTDPGVTMRPTNGEYTFRVHGDKAENHTYTDTNPIYEKNADGSYKLNDKGEKIKKSFGYTISDYPDSISNYKYVLVTRRGTTPMVQGAGYLAMPDSINPGMMYRGFTDSNTGEIYYDENYQKKMEGVVKNFSNMFNGSIAGLQARIPYLKANGYKVLFSTPIANGDDVSSHSYWNKNNMQIASRMGTTENFASFMQDLYKNGMKYVYDGTFTSEGLEGIHFQYALRWAEKNPQSYYWFRMSGLKDANLGLGTIPQNKENLRHRVVNAPYKYELQSNGTYKKVVNSEYNANKPTMFQIYDAAQAGDEQINKLDTAIRNYEKLTSGTPIDINSHDDTLMSFIFQIDPKEYDKRIDVINDLNKKHGKKIKLDTADGTIMASQFSNFRIDRKTEGGFVTWDANTDMVKMNYHISGYDEKLLQSIVNKDERYHEQQLIERGSYEVQDMTLQSMRYWTKFVKDIQTMYTAKTIGSVKTVEGINKLIADGKLPEEAKINNTVINNVLNGQYILEPKGILDKDAVTVKALMELPLDSLEFAENTAGVLSTSYFSNRATKEELVGKTRYELMKENNPHLVETYAKNYNRVNSLFNNEIKSFADSVISKVNDKSNEKLLDANGDYTEYGEYVMELIGKDIAKYAFMKSLAGSSFKTKVLPDGAITYDYDNIKANTNLEDLHIKAHSPEDEAKQLANKIEKGLKGLSGSDIDFVADAISKRIAGTDTASFRLAEALVDRSSLGLDWRLDAAKDVMDQDAVRNEDNDFDDTFNDLIKFWQKGVRTVKTINPHSYIVAEVTDIPDLVRDTTGYDVYPNANNTNIGQKFNGEPDALTKFFNETGITSEAGYSYFYTNLLQVFSPEFECGGTAQMHGVQRHDTFKDRMDLLLQTRGIDYMRNLYTFLDNHDKPRLIHGLALDMGLFHANLLHDYKNFGNNRDKRLDVIRVMSGAKTQSEVPVELRLNVDNNDYFKTVSTRAAAMNKLLMDVLNEDLKGTIPDEDVRLINDALIDLANGNYLGVGTTESLTKIKIKELSSLEDAFNTILTMAEKHGLKLTEAERRQLIEEVVKKANSADLSDYLIQGGLDWKDLPEDIKNHNIEAAKSVLGEKSDYSSYSLYTVQLARLLKDSYIATGKNTAAKDAITAAVKDFAEKYNQHEVVSNSDEFKKIEDPVTAMRKNGYAARDIKLAVSMAVKQAEFKSGRKIANKETIIDNVFKAATEPAAAKASMIMEYLKGLFGIPTMYAGDELGMTGYEEKAKNVYLQNRNALPWTELDEKSLIGGYRKAVMTSMNNTIKDRSNPELHALNDGTPYALDVRTHSKNRDEVMARIAEITKELESKPNDEKLLKERRECIKDLSKIAYMMHSANGDMTISLFNAGDIDHGNRVDYFAKYGLDTDAKRKKFFEDNNIESINPENKYVPIQPKSEVDYIILGAGVAVPVGTIFTNANSRDKARYVVKQIGNELGIVKEGGGKIVMDGKTAKNGVMILKHIKNIIFKGANHKTYFNPQYNFVSNPYKQPETVEEGQKLAIISK